MKILKIIGVVAGVHALALLIMFANPGCSSASKVPAKAAEAPAASAPPTISVASLNNTAPITASPIAVDTPNNPAFDPNAPAASDSTSSSGIRYSPTRPNTPAATAVQAQPVTDVIPASTYVVVGGDSLWTVAKRNHLRVSELAGANGLRTSAVLRPGQKLIIPAKAGGTSYAGSETAAPVSAPVRSSSSSSVSSLPSGEGTSYTVRNGETLSGIAKKFRVTRGSIAKANNLANPTIHPGQVLLIPPAGSTSSTTRAPASAQASAPAPQPSGPISAISADPDLDAGIKSTNPADVPTIKLDSGPNK